jgi:hypothetical protein
VHHPKPKIFLVWFLVYWVGQNVARPPLGPGTVRGVLATRLHYNVKSLHQKHKRHVVAFSRTRTHSSISPHASLMSLAAAAAAASSAPPPALPAPAAPAPFTAAAFRASTL